MCAWEPQSRYLVTGGVDGYLIIWDPDAGTAATVLTRPHTGAAVTALHWAADSKRILSAGDDGTVRVRPRAAAGDVYGFGQSTPATLL